MITVTCGWLANSVQARKVLIPTVNKIIKIRDDDNEMLGTMVPWMDQILPRLSSAMQTRQRPDSAHHAD
jgi:hypothetical protein